MKDAKSGIKNFLQGSKGKLLEHYQARMLDKLSKSCQAERMKFVKIKGTNNLDIKAEILRDYMTDKGDKFKNIDLSRIEIEKSLKHMPISRERMTEQCKSDIAKCRNYNELKSMLLSEEIAAG